MIFLNLGSSAPFMEFSPAIQKALQYLRQTDINAMAAGKYPIDGDRVFAVISDLQTKPVLEIPAEVHRKYIDIQYWQTDGEVFGIAPLLGDEDVAEAHPENDVWYLDNLHNENFVTTQSGDVAVFFPWDVHRPGGSKGAPKVIHKCVVKMDVSLLNQR